MYSQNPELEGDSQSKIQNPKSKMVLLHQNKLRPHHWRRKEVFTLLDECSTLGKTTQYQMQRYVERKTGQKPSPKLIVQWKNKRNIPLSRRLKKSTTQEASIPIPQI